MAAPPPATVEEAALATRIREAVDRVATDVAVDCVVHSHVTGRLVGVFLEAESSHVLASRPPPAGLLGELGLSAPPRGVGQGMSIHLATAKRLAEVDPARDLVLVVLAPHGDWPGLVLRLHELGPQLLAGG